MASTLVARQYLYGGNGNTCYDNNNNPYRCNSSWYDWGRWVALGAIIVGAFLLFFIFSCITSRRRRRLGRQPMYGTGWAGRTPWGHGAATYNPNYQQTQQTNAPPPAYGQQNNGGYYGQNQGYFGGRQTETDVEMQPPQNAYARGGDDVYAPPQGPPPAKK